jgi:antitoxin FitA
LRRAARSTALHVRWRRQANDVKGEQGGVRPLCPHEKGCSLAHAQPADAGRSPAQCEAGGGNTIASLTIRDLPDQTKEVLRVHAARSGLSLEAYARHLLQVSASNEGFQSPGILDLAKKYFGSEAGVELDLPARRSRRTVVDLQP